MKEKIKNKHAITLLALIITVIVLLILVTVSISLIINSGILDHAQQGVDRYSEEEELEQIKLAVASARLKGNGFLTTENLNSELQDRFGGEAIESSNYWNYKSYKIDKDGNVEKTLPAEYQQVEYIESTGTQYVDTRVIPNQDTITRVKFIVNEFLNSNTALFGGRNQYMDKDYSILFGGNQNNENSLYNVIYSGYNNDSKYDYNCYLLSNREYNLVKEKNKTYLNNYLIYESSYAKFNSPYNMYLFSVNQSSNNLRCSYISIYNCTLYENNTLIRNFIPCYSTTTVTDVDGVERPKDTIGMYDTVEGKFYVNKGTGTFLKGADV